MNQLQAQLWNHLEWLEQRGLTGSMRLGEATPMRESTPSEQLLGFYCESWLETDEVNMIHRIAQAMGLKIGDYKIWAEGHGISPPAELSRYPCVVALGPTSGQTLLSAGQTLKMNTLQTLQHGSQLLTIPHPRAMLSEPVLKLGAWAALQALRTNLPSR